ncbi:hypothetical protein ABIC86_002503 [Paenibacillus sp. DS2363]|uniref:hypothetical protein n=1 Tax=Paenibacillus sp. DS2363 TaxID=3156427 RepID=UPI003395341E
MADTIKLFAAAPIPTTSLYPYKVPTGKYAVVKSVIICNSASSPVQVVLYIGNVYIMQQHTIKPNDTLIIDDMDIPMLETEEIRMYASATGCVAHISGFERDYVESEFPYVRVRTAVVNTEGGFKVPGDVDAILKTVIICNSSSTNSNATIRCPQLILSQKEIKAFDTVILPKLKLFIPKSNSIYHMATANGMQATFIFEKVVQ